MNRSLSLTLAFTVAITSLAVGGSRHLRLVSSYPSADTTLDAGPSTIRLSYNQVPSLAVSRIGLAGPGGEHEVGRPRAGDDDMTLVADVKGVAEPGSYTISWRTAGGDGHVLRGTIVFTVADTKSRR